MGRMSRPAFELTEGVKITLLATSTYKSLLANIFKNRRLRDEREDNEPVEKVTFLKTASSAGSKIGNCFLSSKVLMILGTMFAFS